LVSRLQGRPAAKTHGHWKQPAATWNWEGRAADFDAEQARLRQVDEFNRRQATVDHLLALVVQAVLTADLPALSQAEARKLLPTLRLFYRDLFVAQGQEWTRTGELPTLGAEEMRLLLEQADHYRLLAEADGGTADVATSDAEMSAPAAWQPLRDELAALYPDEASARRVAAQAGLNSARIVFGGAPVNLWHGVLTEAERGGQIDAVAAVARQEYPATRRCARPTANISRLGLCPRRRSWPRAAGASHRRLHPSRRCKTHGANRFKRRFKHRFKHPSKP
jgi:hypothetical protein